MKRYDVVVAGGGASGLSAAISAASRGCRVLVMEMQAQIGGQGSPAWIGDSLWKRVPASVLARVREVRLRSPGASAEVRGELGVIIDRRIFDRGLAARAAEAGAEIWLSAPVRDLLVRDGRVAGVRSGVGNWSEEIAAEVVIDATGSSGEWSGVFMRKVAGREWSREELAFCGEYLVANFDAGGVELVFNPYLTPGGHAWVYPCGRGMAAVGVQGIRINPELALDEFIGKDQVEGLRKSMPVAAFRSRFPLGGPPERTYAAGIVVAGGAAGQIYQLSPKGLSQAVRAGEIAGEVAAGAISEGNVSEESMAGYEERWRREIHNDIQIGSELRKSLGTFQGRKMDALLSRAGESQSVRRALVNIFLCRDLRRSVRAILNDPRASGVLGGESLERLLS